MHKNPSRADTGHAKIFFLFLLSRTDFGSFFALAAENRTDRFCIQRFKSIILLLTAEDCADRVSAQSSKEGNN